MFLATETEPPTDAVRELSPTSRRPCAHGVQSCPGTGRRLSPALFTRHLRFSALIRTVEVLKEHSKALALALACLSRLA